LGAILVLYGYTGLARAGVVSVQDDGAGADYMSGEPITLPAATLSTNLFRNGVHVIRNRLHTVRPATFDSAGRLDYMKGEPSPPATNGGTNRTANGAGSARSEAGSDETEASRDSHATNGFPRYLDGQQYVWFLQDVRHYTNYSCTVTVDCPSTFYLLVDNRINDYLPGSEYDDPSFGAPDTQWVLDDGWKRVNTGLSPGGRGDYVSIDEGNNGSVNQVYAVYSKTLGKPGAITLGTEFDGNIYCLVISTNAPGLGNPGRPAAAKQAANR